jgi:hypothetical protein
MNKETKSGGIGFCGLLTIVFIVLKLCNVIAWSWWWVLAPSWIPAAFALAIIVIGAVCGIIADAIERSEEKK